VSVLAQALARKQCLNYLVDSLANALEKIDASITANDYDDDEYSQTIVLLWLLFMVALRQGELDGNGVPDCRRLCV
jgi:hypothetical protein